MADKETIELVRKLVTGALIALMSSTIRALMVTKEPIMSRIRIFAAGVCLGLLLAYILRDSRLQGMYKEVIISVSSAGISTIWPIFEKFLKAYLIKKGKDVVPDIDSK